MNSRRLNQRNLYTFRVATKDINRIPCPDAVFLLGTSTKETMKFDIKDPIRQLVPQIPMINIPVKVLKSYQDIYDIVGRILSGNVRNCSLATPIQYVSVKSVNRCY